MANEKISALPAAGSSSGSDLYPLVQGGSNYSITFSNLQSSIAAALVPAQLPTITLTGPITGSAAGGIITTTITTNTVTNTKLAQMASLTIKGNNTGSSANASDLTVAQVNAILPVFSSSLNGLVPASGGGTVNYLRADGTWADLPGTGTVNSVGTFDGISPSPNGSTISGADIFFQSASVSNPGMVNTTTQTFAGNKTFDGHLQTSNNILDDGSGNAIFDGLVTSETGFNAAAYKVDGAGISTIQMPGGGATTYNFNLPNDAGTAGYQLTSGGGGSAPMTWAATTGFAPSSSIVLYDDFTADTDAGSLNWGLIFSGGGFTPFFIQDNYHPGVFEFNTASSSSSWGGLFLTPYILFGGGVATYESVINIDNLSNSTDTFTVRTGVGDMYDSSVFNNGVWFEYTDTGSSPNWQCINATGGTITTIDSGVAVVAGPWVRLGWQVNASGTSVSFYINGALVATSSANIPTTSPNEVNPIFIIMKNAGTTTRRLRTDYYYYKQVFTISR